jgi:DNA helicase-2/ATP-dependent DNA helicase PcrA
MTNTGMDDFTDEQKAFLEHDPSKNGQLIAGPGAGKSYTCVAYMERHGAKDEIPARIRMLTFTRAAAAEFAEKMQKQGLGEAIQRPSTIHAFALSILRLTRSTRVPQPVRIADDWETSELIRPQLARLLKAQGHDVTPSLVEDLEKDMAAGFESMNPGKPLYTTLHPDLRNAYQGRWNEHREKLGYLLLAELPYRAGMAVNDLGVPTLNLDLLLVDEYQDLNRADIRLIELIAEAGIAVVAIGDEDQSIYGNRRAAPEGIREFPDTFGVDPEARHRFTISRRCGSAILRAAQNLIEQAPGRPKQPAMTPYDTAKVGVIEYLRFDNMVQEAQGIAAIVRARVAAGVAKRDIAILVRSRVPLWVAALQPTFFAYGIDIASDSWVQEALEDRELRRLRALAQLTVNPDDSLAWMGLLHLKKLVGPVLIDGIYRAVSVGETFATALRRVAADGTEALQPPELKKLRELAAEVERDLADFVVDDTGDSTPWGEWIAARAKSPLSEQALRLLRLVDEKLNAATLEGFLANFEQYGRDFALSEQDGVRVMTMTKSKGLTFDTAIVAGVEADMIPLPPPKGDPDEQRRMLYVAMTRATDYCVLTYCGIRSGSLAHVGRKNLGLREHSPMLTGVLRWKKALPWLKDRSWL